MKVRYVFSEMPYAVALSETYLKSRCSFCAGDATEINSNRRWCSCQSVIYCGDSCLENDRSLHEHECMAFKLGHSPGETESAHLGVRLMGRIVARYRLDKGVVDLSSDFPSDHNKNRCFDDLMTHAWDLRRSHGHELGFKELKSNFYPFFHGTPLASTPKSVLRKFYYRLCINGFSLYIRLSADPDSSEELGESIYLNASRFNHSCRPSCLYRFDGARIVIEYIDHKADQSIPIKFVGQEFENLTLQYGFQSDSSYVATCPMVDQRRHALKGRYFFKCRCELCADKTRTRIEANAAPIECVTCKSPYVWDRKFFLGTMRLKKTCTCGKDKGTKSEETKMISIMFGKKASEDVKKLAKMWSKSMTKANNISSLRVTSKIFKPLLLLADKYWHPVYNIRRGQATEQLFWAIQSATVASESKFIGTPDDLNLLLKYGESILITYTTYFEPYMLPVITYAADVADLYKLRGFPDDLIRSDHWYKYAIQTWIDRGDIDCAEMIEKRASAPPMEWSPKVPAKKSMEETEESSDEESGGALKL